MTQERLQFRRNGVAVGDPCDVERFLSGAVACDDQTTRVPVPDRECEHPVEPREHAVAPLLETVDEHLGVAVVCCEDVAAADELLTKLREVVDLAVEYDATSVAFVPHWLVTTLQIDDAQATHPERDAVLPHDFGTAVVRPTVNQGIRHRVDLTLEVPREQSHDCHEAAHSNHRAAGRKP